MKTFAEADWIQQFREWDYQSSIKEYAAFAAMDILTAAGFTLLRERRQAIIDAAEAGVDNDLVTGRDAVGVAFENGMCVVTNEYVESQEAIVHPDELIRLIDWRLDILESPDFKNAQAHFEPIEIEYFEVEASE